MSMRKALHQEPTGTMYDEQERQKTLRLQREHHEPQEPRLEWIYTGDRSKSEDYLLGKKYDGEVQSNPVPEDNAIASSTIDLANKIREDPLYLIKKREIEQKKSILENPVRLKQLKELLERQESSQSSSHKKRRHSRSRSRSPPPRSHHHHHPHPRHRRSPSPARHRRRSRSPSPRRRHRPSPPPRSAPAPRRERTPPRQYKPSKEERDRRIREMLSDGAVRTEQRQQNIRSYKARDDQEEKVNEVMKQRARKRNEDSSSDDEEHDFIQPMMRQVVDDPSLKRRDLKHHHHKRR